MTYTDKRERLKVVKDAERSWEGIMKLMLDTTVFFCALALFMLAAFSR